MKDSTSLRRFCWLQVNFSYAHCPLAHFRASNGRNRPTAEGHDQSLLSGAELVGLDFRIGLVIRLQTEGRVQIGTHQIVLKLGPLVEHVQQRFSGGGGRGCCWCHRGFFSYWLGAQF
jgi:hypothetical protein